MHTATVPRCFDVAAPGVPIRREQAGAQSTAMLARRRHSGVGYRVRPGFTLPPAAWRRVQPTPAPTGPHAVHGGTGPRAPTGGERRAIDPSAATTIAA